MSFYGYGYVLLIPSWNCTVCQQHTWRAKVSFSDSNETMRLRWNVCTVYSVHCCLPSFKIWLRKY